MNIDYADFNNGLEVDETVDKLEKDGYDEEVVRDFFMRAQDVKYIVPYRDKVNAIPLFNSKDGLKLIPVFASFSAFEKCPLPKEKASIMHFDKVNDIVKNSKGQIGGIIINPHGKSMIFRHNGAETKKNQQGTAMKFMSPAFVPENLVNALKNYFSECENVYAAYILWAQKEEELAPHIFLVVDFDGKKEDFFPKVVEAIKPCLKPGDNLEMAKADFKLLKASEKIVKPIYKKS
ncbi:MAG: enhanced serine sensitivity protein SseB C-terminal domain-containing protein [Oscillospiraceae bacterium]|nr:enhanced serine sensitivity protein SseB C-terminal domain-containing protein [Oscillospiraceae bacterium]MBR3952425.1 enhanced serine sensitivity protein SseB C-terminal domain-containing protein [Oscillospiraceae bacterium]